MTELRGPLDERKLDLVRQFLRERFRGYRISEQFDFDKTAQVFRMDSGSGRTYQLIVSKEALDDSDFAFLLDDRVVDVLEQAGALSVVLTSRGPIIEVDLSEEQRRKLFGKGTEKG